MYMYLELLYKQSSESHSTSGDVECDIVYIGVERLMVSIDRVTDTGVCEGVGVNTGTIRQYEQQRQLDIQGSRNTEKYKYTESDDS